MIQGPEHLMYGEKAVPVQPGEEKPWEYFINVYIYLVEGNEKDGPKLFPVVSSDRTRGNGYKQKCRKFFFYIIFIFYLFRQAAQRSYAVLTPGATQNSTGHFLSYLF